MGRGSLKNFKGKRHQFTNEDRVKGGSSKSNYKRFVLNIRTKDKCSPRCPYFPCFFSVGSKEGECVLAKQSPRVWRSFYRLILGEENAFNNEMREALFKIMIKGGPKDIINYGERVHRMLFGNKERVEANVNVFDELIKELKIKPEEPEE